MNNEEKGLMRVAQKSLAVKSLRDLVRARSSENGVLLIDTSISMGAFMRNGKSRIEGLREVVAGLQAKRPTPMIAFGSAPVPLAESAEAREMQDRESVLSRRFGTVGVVTEVPDAKGGGTPLTEGIDHARELGYGRAVVISDGGPNDRSSAMEAARNFGGQIDVIFVGDPEDGGSIFLEELAKVTGGTRFEGDLSDVKELTGAVIGLLNGEALEQDENGDGDDDDEEDEDDEDDDIEDAEEID